MRIIIEDCVPFVKGLLEPYAEVQYLPSSQITAEAMAKADALITRTRTRCDEALLHGSPCQFIATATIGTDHIDLPWCASRGIAVASAPGCNAPAVAQYVLASILRLTNRPVEQYTIGIVGVGHVGSIVERWCRALEMDVMLCDPPRQAAEGGDQWCSLADIAREADIITFHTPLTDETRHMADAAFFASLRRHPMIINAARGAVVDTLALIAAIEDGQVHGSVIDCWEHEPEISRRLLELADIATPHIAGYSREGKIRASRMALDALTTHFELPRVEMAEKAAVEAATTVTAPAVIRSYDPLADTARLKAHPEMFEQLRDTYELRREVAAGKIS